jgi:exosome complex component RRP42
MSLSPYERAFVLDGIDQDLRVDGRGRLDHRSMTLELGTSPQASGSARLRLGDTDVMVAVKADIGTPPKAYPTHGRLSCAVELSASADPAFEGRGGERFGVELSRALERGLLGASAGGAASLSAVAAGARGGGYTARSSTHGAGAALDMSLLGIQKGKTCWVLQCDCLVLCADGNALDALSLAVKAALADTKIPKVSVTAGPNGDDPTELELDDDPEECSRFDVSGVPLTVTVTRLGGRFVVDATEDETQHSNAALAVAVDSSGNVRGVSQMAPGGSSASAQPRRAGELVSKETSGIDLASLRGALRVARAVGARTHRALDEFLKTTRSASSGFASGSDEDVEAMDS